ncbi:MAG: hypothetical protein GY805_23140 [Chloroflexi bacterium]|nr:hypothetical protein [Chloroflexota bacterium]
MATFIKHHFAFGWFSDDWNAWQKWLSVILYVTFFNIGLIPILSVAEKMGLLIEGSFKSLGILVILLLLWFALYQPVINFVMTRGRKSSH